MGAHHFLRNGLGSRALVACVVAALTASNAAHAQDNVELNAGWGRWYGDFAATARSGSMLGASYLADFGIPVHLGLDVRFARSGYDVPIPDVPQELSEFQTGLVVRKFLRGPQSRMRPFVSAKAGYTRLSIDVTSFRLEQNGVYVGPVLGTAFSTGSRLSPLFAIEVLRQHYGDTRLFLEDEALSGSGGTAWRVFARVGLTFDAGRRTGPRSR